MLTARIGLKDVHIEVDEHWKSGMPHARLTEGGMVIVSPLATFEDLATALSEVYDGEYLHVSRMPLEGVG